MAAPAGPSVSALAVRLRERHLTTLTAEVSQQVLAALPDLPGSEVVTVAEMREACAVSIEQMLCELSGEGQRISLTDTGRRRAQQRVPVEWLLHNFRLCARTIWHGLVREAGCSGDGGAHRLLEEAAVVWDALDRVSTVVTKAYRVERNRLRRTAQRRREQVLSALLERAPTAQGAEEEAADVLGIPPRGPRVVVVSSVGSGHPTTALRSAGYTSAWVTQGPRDVGLIAWGAADDLPELAAILGNCLPGSVTVSPLIHGFEDVATAYRLTALALRTLPSGYQGITQVTDRLPHTMIAAVPEVSDVLVRHTLGGLLTVRAGELEVYLATLEALVDADGSFAAAARKLYCHRNTVLKRAHRIEALTGRRLTSTRALLELYLAVLAVRMDATGRFATSGPIS
ncbi:PucR family transcriptional regulator [Cryptosporangium aurantiacum]|uniref:PucR C-terminal helix-turn-helix domain-containing protein n=1 Tax=Cryptosporangium aurantiacum TaxID=134849 RepID=A0A1M7PC39_9ACTN|nr:PucR family transcriptional regulator [Cryptosporangium aurantiacum]SHN13928.1 PucR C-terminal helix-turn-helix domain-containing protein [Cryptosporangium aurantiacum]